MNIALFLAIAGPAGAGMLVLAWGGSDRSRRLLALVGLGAGTGGAIATLVAVLGDEVVASRGFEADAWRAGLVLAVLIVSAAAVPSAARDAFSGAAHLAATSAAVASLLATDVFSASAFLIATTAGYAVLAYGRGTRDAQRAVPWFAGSDLAAIVGLLLLSDRGMRVPPDVRGAGAVLLVVAAVARSGILPLPRWFEAGLGADRALGSLALGAMRAQALVILGWVSLARAREADLLLGVGIVAALAAAAGARRAAREGSAAGAAAAQMGLVMAGMALGGVAPLWGAILLAAGMFLAAALGVLGSTRVGAPSLGAAPLGATLPGAALIVTSALTRGIVDASDLAVAIPAAVALMWLALAGVAGVRGVGGARTHPAWSVVPLLAATAIAVLPGWALTGIAPPAGLSLAAGRPLEPVRAALPNDAGIIFAVAAMGALLSLQPARAAAATAPVPATSVPAPAARASLRVATAIVAVSVGWLIVLLWVGLRRRFL